MFTEVMKIAFMFVMKKHMYMFDNQIKRQSEGGPIGLGTLDLTDLLKKFQKDPVPMKDGNVLKKIVVHGNQLMEQACNTQWT